MTSPVAVIGLTYDGFDLQRSDLDLMFAITDGLDGLPLTRGDDPVIPFRRGRLPQNHVADRRPVVAQGWVTGRTPTAAIAYRAYLDSLKAHLDPTGPPRTLVATMEDGTRRWISAVPRNLIGGNDGMGSDFRSFSIEWDALDPFWYGSYGYIALDSGLFLDTGHSLDEGTEIVIPASTPTVSVTVPGTADTERVRVRFTGPSSGPVGIEVDSNLGFVMANALPTTTGVGSSAQTVTVDNWARTVVDGTGASLRSQMTLRSANIHGEYVRLTPGTHSIRILGAPFEARLLLIPTYL